MTVTKSVFIGAISIVSIVGCRPSATPSTPPASAQPPQRNATAVSAAAGPVSRPPVTDSPACSMASPEACVAQCEAGQPTACFTAGVGFHQRPAASRDDSAAVQSYRRGCELGEMQSCGNLGLMFEKGWGVQRDIAKASALYAQACKASVAIACRNVGRLSEPSGPLPDPARSAEFYHRALDLALQNCDDGAAEGCAAAGYMYEDGKGTAPDPTRGRELVKRACSLGYSWACKPREKN